jgi:CheY-like chemotaxis protein
VLVVEDEPDVAELIRHHLSRDGYDVVVSVTGADALLHARDGRVDAVLLDIMVPQLNGWEVCRRLKQDAETRAIPVIMVTGRVEEGWTCISRACARSSCRRRSHPPPSRRFAGSAIAFASRREPVLTHP